MRLNAPIRVCTRRLLPSPRPRSRRRGILRAHARDEHALDLIRAAPQFLDDHQRVVLAPLLVANETGSPSNLARRIRFLEPVTSAAVTSARAPRVTSRERVGLLRRCESVCTRVSRRACPSRAPRTQTPRVDGAVRQQDPARGSCRGLLARRWQQAPSPEVREQVCEPVLSGVELLLAGRDELDLDDVLRSPFTLCVESVFATAPALVGHEHESIAAMLCRDRARPLAARSIATRRAQA